MTPMLVTSQGDFLQEMKGLTNSISYIDMVISPASLLKLLCTATHLILVLMNADILQVTTFCHC